MEVYFTDHQTPEQQQEALEKLLQHMRTVAQAVMSVEDKASADAAAEMMKETKNVIQNEALMEIISSMDAEVVSKAMKDAVSEKEIDATIKRIRENDYYGSEKLKSM